MRLLNSLVHCHTTRTFSEFLLMVSSGLSRSIHGDSLATIRVDQFDPLSTLSLRVRGPGRSGKTRRNSRL